ncbi:MAG: fumarylacetoacetate hydrolase family protein [Synechococcus sp.]|nr:fumarylacetoacetate hydrolase family protein [Synechococcus sp.]
MPILRYLDPDGAVQHGRLHRDGSCERLQGDPFLGLHASGEPARVARLLCPIEPRAILGIGVNYRRHALEFGSPIPQRPVLFFKAPGARQHPDAPIELPGALVSTEVDYEGELAVVIGRTCKNVHRDEALSYVLGYTCANDVSARDWQKQPQLGGGQWCRGKSFDTFAPLGPCLATAAELPDPSALQLRTWLNGELVQEAGTDDMIFDVPSLIEFLSGSTTLEAGTVILTGTPSGVGMAARPPRWLQPGDRVAVEITGIGRLENPVVREAAAAVSPWSAA